MSEKQPLLIQAHGEEPTSLKRPMLFTLIAALGPLAFGYTMGYTSPVGDALKDSDHGLGLNTDQNSLFGSIVNVGAMVGALSGGVIADALGRTWAIRISTLPFILGFLFIYFAESFALLIAGRIACGVGVGIVSLAVPVYIAEIAPSSHRGALGAANQLSITIGIVIVYALGLVCKWRLLALIGAIIPGALLVLSFFLPRTPHWLVSKQRQDEARLSLLRLRGEAKHVQVDLELQQIVESQAASSKESASITDLFRGATRRAMVVGALLMLYQQFSGVNAVFFFNSSIFEDAGVDNASVASLSVGAVQVVFTAISCVLVDRAGRRVLLMFAGIGISSACAILGYYFHMKDHGHDISGVLAVLMVIAYVIFFSLGLGAVPWLMMSEIFPSRVRGLASSVATLINWSCAFIVTETFDSLKNAITESGVFWFYGAVCIAGASYVLVGVPETKGRSLGQIEAYFEGDTDAIPRDTSGQRLVAFTAIGGLIAVGVTVLATSL
eukprot:m.229221 g.229221  ORF g.229221 m.229221 type:complete len:497 (+) comp17699_c0_seq1:1102-2592(+)